MLKSEMTGDYFSIHYFPFQILLVDTVFLAMVCNNLTDQLMFGDR